MNSHHQGKGRFGRQPHGREGRARAGNADEQRRRLIDSMVVLAGERGYVASSVAALIARAGVSRKTFYERVHSRDDLLLAAFDAVTPKALRQAQEAAEGPRPLDRIAALLSQGNGHTRGALALSAVEIAAVNGSGTHRRERLIGDYAQALATALRRERGGEAPTPLICRALAGGLQRTLLAHARSDDPADVPEVARQLARWARCYQPLPVPLTRVARPAGPAAEDLLGGRAPGTFTFAQGLDLPLATVEPRGSVVHADRERILDAVAQLSSRIGYVRLSVPAIAQQAEISEQAFHRYFRSRNEAFAAALEIGHLKALAAVRRARLGAPDWAGGVSSATRALLAFLACEPYFTRMAFVDAPFAGLKISRRAHDYVGVYARLLLGDAPRGRRAPAVAPEAAVYALFELAFEHALQRRANELLSLTPEAGYLLLAPFLGPEQAARVALG